MLSKKKQLEEAYAKNVKLMTQVNQLEEELKGLRKSGELSEEQKSTALMDSRAEITRLNGLIEKTTDYRAKDVESFKELVSRSVKVVEVVDELKSSLSSINSNLKTMSDQSNQLLASLAKDIQTLASFVSDLSGEIVSTRKKIETIWASDTVEEGDYE